MSVDAIFLKHERKHHINNMHEVVIDWTPQLDIKNLNINILKDKEDEILGVFTDHSFQVYSSKFCILHSSFRPKTMCLSIRVLSLNGGQLTVPR